MTSTRHAPPGTPLRQDRFASSPDIERGLLANLVAARCAGLSREDAELIWWMQRQPMPALAAAILDRWPDRVDETTARERAGIEVFRRHALDSFGSGPRQSAEERAQEENEACARLFKQSLSRFHEDVARLALDPALPVADGWPEFFPKLCSTLHELKRLKTQEAEGRFTHTSVSRAVWDAVDEVRRLGGLKLLLHESGTGASYSAAHYCRIHSGAARFARVPASNDEVGFFRNLCEPVGVASGFSFKAVQMREKLQQVLRGKQLVLILAGAQWLFQVTDFHYGTPKRFNWLLTALCEYGVPVLLLARFTEFFEALGRVEKRTGWNRRQFLNQLTSAKQLPTARNEEDAGAVATALLPDGHTAAQRRLADFMFKSPGYLHAGEPAARRARAVAQERAHARVALADMEEALAPWGESLQTLAAGLRVAEKIKSKGHGRNQRTGATLPAPGAGKSRSLIVTSSDLAQPGHGAPDEQFPPAERHPKPSHASRVLPGGQWVKAASQHPDRRADLVSA